MDGSWGALSTDYMKVGKDLSHWQGGFNKPPVRTIAVYARRFLGPSLYTAAELKQEGEHVPHLWPRSATTTRHHSKWSTQSIKSTSGREMALEIIGSYPI